MPEHDLLSDVCINYTTSASMPSPSRSCHNRVCRSACKKHGRCGTQPVKRERTPTLQSPDCRNKRDGQDDCYDSATSASYQRCRHKLRARSSQESRKDCLLWRVRFGHPTGCCQTDGRRTCDPSGAYIPTILIFSISLLVAGTLA